LPRRLPQLTVWPPLPLAIYVRAGSRELPFPLGEPGCRLVPLGRHALWQGIRALRLGSGDEVLAPAYHHGTEIEALVHAGLICRFYEASETLQPDEAELEALLGPRTRALLLIHYLGFPQEVTRWRSWCDDRGLLLLEDAAQAWLATTDGRPVGAFGDAAIFCLYKMFGLPDGAALVLKEALPQPRGPRAGAWVTLALRHKAWVESRVPLAATKPPWSGELDLEAEFGLGDPEAQLSASSAFVLGKAIRPGAAEARRENYRFLLERLGEFARAPFDRLPDGASPFAFPVDTGDKGRLLAELARRNVRALDFWSVGHPALPAEEFPEASARRTRTVAVPVHQELRRKDVERIADAVAGAAAVTGPRRREAE
jgi:dTDP-4-amino-4,6-dideoxygalactose transaminase